MDKLQKNLIKIGITFDIPKRFADLYCSGIRQHNLYFCELLLNVGYDVYLVVNEQNLKETTELTKILYDPRFKIVNLSDIFQYHFDIFVVFGFLITESEFKQLKLNNTKVISHKCGNDYIIKTEDIIYNLNRIGLNNYYLNYDQMWSIPQNINQNKHYWEILHRTECIEVPFIW